MNPRTLHPFVLAVALAALGAGIGAYTARYYAPPPAPIEGLMWPNPKQLGAFQVVDHEGREFGVDRLRGSWSFLFFGYTHCPDICPITLAVLGRVQSALEAEGVSGAPVQTVFVSVDPERDTPEQIAPYVRHFHERLIGLGGTLAQVQGLTAQLGIAFYHDAPAADGSYLVDHSASVFLIDPQARLVSIFPAPQEVEGLLAKFRQIRRFIEQSAA
jgi:protein SCO1/2